MAQHPATGELINVPQCCRSISIDTNSCDVSQHGVESDSIAMQVRNQSHAHR